VFFAGLRYYGIEKGYAPGWAANQYRNKFKVWPGHSIVNVVPRPPSMQVRQWIKHSQIAWMLSQRRK
jgi:hypothetical protein